MFGGNKFKEFGERLASERTKLGKSQIEVAHELGVHPDTFNNYEKGSRDIPNSLLSKLWDLGFDVMYISTGVYNE